MKLCQVKGCYARIYGSARPIIEFLSFTDFTCMTPNEAFLYREVMSRSLESGLLEGQSSHEGCHELPVLLLSFHPSRLRQKAASLKPHETFCSPRLFGIMPDQYVYYVYLHGTKAMVFKLSYMFQHIFPNFSVLYSGYNGMNGQR